VSAERKTVLVALAANASIAIAKGAAGLLTGSAAMLAEAAHSVADMANQAFLLTSLALGEKGPDQEHPFGHGKERFFWAFLAAVLIFVAGAVFSIGYGVLELLRSASEGSYAVAYATLAFAFLAEGTSLIRAVRQVRREAGEGDIRLREYVRISTEPAVKTVLYEDTVAVTGVVVAATGIGLSEATGEKAWDAAAAIVVGVMLVYVAIVLGRNFRGLLIGAGARPDDRETIRRVLARHPEIDEVVDLRTMYVGPRSLLVAARLDIADGVDSNRVEELATELERELRNEVAEVGDVFLDPTQR
jgi:cation diffusion facilitator family transporter